MVSPLQMNYTRDKIRIRQVVKTNPFQVKVRKVKGKKKKGKETLARGEKKNN